MPIVFEPKLSEYSKPFKKLLVTYFLGKSFASLDSALNQEYEKGHRLSELFEVCPLIKTFTPTNLPATLESKVTEIDILWKQSEKNGNSTVTLQGIPVLTARFIAN